MATFLSSIIPILQAAGCDDLIEQRWGDNLQSGSGKHCVECWRRAQSGEELPAGASLLCRAHSVWQTGSLPILPTQALFVQ